MKAEKLINELIKKLNSEGKMLYDSNIIIKLRSLTDYEFDQLIEKINK